MKRILFLVPLFIFSCKEKDCNCNEVRTERTAIYTVGTSTTSPQFISATDWQIVNQKPFAGDCDLNNKQLNNGSFNLHLLPNNQFIRTEYETKISCQ